MELCSNFCLIADVRGSAEDLEFLFVLYDKMGVEELEMWVIDSAASNHFTVIKENICNFVEIPLVKVLTGNSKILGVGKGEVLLATKLGERLVEDVI